MKLSQESLVELRAALFDVGIVLNDDEVLEYGLDLLKYTHMMTKDVEIKKYLDFTTNET